MKYSDRDYVSLILCHYSIPDDFGGTSAIYAEETRSEMLRTTMETLEANTDFPCEIIVIDNGGPDDDSNYLVELTRKGVINTYIRNKNNMNFGWAWDQGARLATGKYIGFTCNDIGFHKKWLSTTMKPILKYPDKKLIATPLITPDKMKPKYDRGRLDKYRLNSLAGSNCMFMKRETYEDLGVFSTNRIAGTIWHRRITKMGYVVVAPPKNFADHLAHQGGYNYRVPAVVKTTLLNDKEYINKPEDGTV